MAGDPKENISVTRQVLLRNRHGLHARPAALFVEMSNRFQSKITVRKGEEEEDAKNILAIMTLGVGPGTTLTISAIGPDAPEAVSALVKLVEDNFGEPADEASAAEG
ncbi:MAG: HPr family phosphocarrier protein [Planctomycetota bacterium]|nr:HPr family phosphocarrier protein [Planctomycetota bacterium]